jgi:multisubunit Na+/H+ antiporter MnhF subunit
MANDDEKETERELNVHIFSVSAELVGVCLTVIGLFRVIFRLKQVDSLADNVLAVDAVGFLVTCTLAYASLRSRTQRHRRALERAADSCFVAALLLMTVVCGLVAWELM